MISKDTKFLIVGLGLMGGSYAKALSQKGYHVDAIDINEESLQYAIDHQFIKRGSSDSSILLPDADIIISALYPTTMINWIKEHQQDMKPGALMSDVSGVKGCIVKEVQAILRDDVEFCASHPMAGKEVSGVQYADESIFKIANFIITPTDKNTYKAIETIKEIASLLEFANISILSIEKHDEMIGYVSQLTHAIAVSLMNANDDPNLVAYTGDSFRDLTRIAKINETLWSELFFLNKDNLIREINDFVSTLNHLKETLETNDAEELKRLFRSSTQRRKLFDQKEKRQ